MSPKEAVLEAIRNRPSAELLELAMELRVRVCNGGFQGEEMGAVVAELTRRLSPTQRGNGSTHWHECWRDRGHHECAVAEIARLRSEQKGRRIEGWATEGGYDFHFSTRTGDEPLWKPATLIIHDSAPISESERRTNG